MSERTLRSSDLHGVKMEEKVIIMMMFSWHDAFSDSEWVTMNKPTMFGAICMEYVYVESKPFIIALSYHFFAHWIVSREGHSGFFVEGGDVVVTGHGPLTAFQSSIQTLFFRCRNNKKHNKSTHKRIRWSFIQQQSECDILCHHHHIVSLCVVLLLWRAISIDLTCRPTDTNQHN